MEDFLIELNYKQYRFIGSAYGQINTTTIILQGIILPILGLFSLICCTIFAVISDPSLWIFSIFILLI